MKKTDEGMNDTIINNLHKETVETTPDDGFINAKEIRPASIRSYKLPEARYLKGFAKTVTYTTSDPRITRPFAYGLSGIFIAIGILLLLFGNWFSGIMSTFIGTFALVKSKKDIDRIAEKMEAEGKDVTFDSPEEKEQFANQVKELAKDSFTEVTSGTYTKDNRKSFAQKTIPVYCIFAAIVTIALGAFVNVFLGVVALIVLSATGVLYYYLFSKLFR